VARLAVGLSERSAELERAVEELAAAVVERNQVARARLRLVDLMLGVVAGDGCRADESEACRREAELVVEAMETLFARYPDGAYEMVRWVVDTIFRGIRPT
jgi:hypothetical protein